MIQTISPKVEIKIKCKCCEKAVACVLKSIYLKDRKFWDSLLCKNCKRKINVSD